VKQTPGQISFAEVERMMKVQEVILRAMAGKLKWWEAAEIIGVTDRTMRRWRQCASASRTSQACSWPSLNLAG
jgi:hypothetical protein